MLNAQTGNRIALDDIIPAGVYITVQGDFSVGAFNLGNPNATVPDDDPVCVAAGEADMDTPRIGNLVPNQIAPNLATLSTGPIDGSGTSSRTYQLCVQVDDQGPNDVPIPTVTYWGSVTAPQTSIDGDGRELASGIIGKIARNGTRVAVPYLTVSEKYSQRLIVVNRGSAKTSYRIEFLPEAGVTVDFTPEAIVTQDANGGAFVVEPQSRQVIRTDRLFTVTRQSAATGTAPRTSATLFFEANPGDIHVATVQISRFDASTDTVVYPSLAGLPEANESPGAP